VVVAMVVIAAAGIGAQALGSTGQATVAPVLHPAPTAAWAVSAGPKGSTPSSGPEGSTGSAGPDGTTGSAGPPGETGSGGLSDRPVH
jgi:hypothetical protein